MNALLALCVCMATTLDANPPVVMILKDSKTLGAAVIIDPRGYAVTCGHVLGRRETVLVQFRDRSQLPADVVALQPESDLALLKIRGDWRYLPAALATETPRLRQPVLALGHPKGYSFTYTTGIISALDREVLLPGGDPIRGLLQTDAAINPGSSGGALLNLQGELLGLPVAMVDGAQGIAFVIPAKAIKKLLEKHLPARAAPPE